MRELQDTHISLGDVPDIIHIFDVALMFHCPHCNGLFTYFGGHIFLNFDAQIFEHQVTWGGG